MMADNENDQEACTDASSDFEGATQTNPTEKENTMSSDILSKVDLPFKDHFIYTESEITNADVDRLLRPILEAHGVGLSDYDPYNLSFKIGEKSIQLSVEDYQADEDFEEIMYFGREPFDLKKTVWIKNRSSIKGTEILVDFVKAFQKIFPVSFFDVGGKAYVETNDIQDLYIDGVLMYDPDTADLMEIEDPESYLKELHNGQ